MPTPEGKIADFLCREARRRGLFVRKCRWEGRVGCPDYLIIRDGRAFFVETKAPGESPRPSQVAEFDRLRAAGASVVVANSENGVLEALARAVEVTE